MSNGCFLAAPTPWHVATPRPIKSWASPAQIPACPAGVHPGGSVVSVGAAEPLMVASIISGASADGVNVVLARLCISDDRRPRASVETLGLGRCPRLWPSYAAVYDLQSYGTHVSCATVQRKAQALIDRQSRRVTVVHV